MTKRKTDETPRDRGPVTRSMIDRASEVEARATERRTIETSRAAAKMIRRKTVETSRAEARATTRKTDETPRATVRETKRKTGEAPRFTVQATKKKTYEAPRATVRATKRKTYEAPRTTVRATKRKTGEAPRTTVRTTKRRTGEAPRTTVRATKRKTGETPITTVPATKRKTDETPRAASRATKRKTDKTEISVEGSCATDTTGDSRKKSFDKLPRPEYQHTSASYSAEPIYVVDPDKVTASHVADINVSAFGDTHFCGISGSAVVSADRLLLADHHNNKVKLVDTRRQKLICVLQLPSRPWDIAVIRTNQAAVTLPDSKKILLLGVADTLLSQREIAVGGVCHGIAYIRDRLVVTYVYSSCVEIIDLYGNVTRTIETGSDGSKLFGCPRHVCVSRDAETIYVTDVYCRPVTSLTFDGVVKYVYNKNDELRFPQKVCTDHHGNVYVCGYKSDNVHMITADCRKIKIILTRADGLDLYPWSVSHCQDTNRLFIGSLNNKTVKVFQLCQETPLLV